MRRPWSQAQAFAAGTTVAGALVGLGEGLYRDVDPVYAATLYAVLWTLVGGAMSVGFGLLKRRKVMGSGLAVAGFAFAGGASLMALGRFVLFRDLFGEAPQHALTATGLAVVLGGAFFLVCIGLGRRLPDGLPLPWLVPTAAILAFAGLATRADAPLSPAPPAQNLEGSGVILIVADALRADALGSYGATLHRGVPATPNLDALARQGLLFRDASAQASWTRPAVASLLTSRHAAAHGTMAKTAVLPNDLPTLAASAQQAGIHTGAIVTNYNLEAGFGFARGFDHFRYLAPARYLGAPERANRLAAYNAYRVLRERYLPLPREARHFYRSGVEVNTEAMLLLDQIAAGAEDRFFLWLHYMEPHDPYFSTTGESYARVAHPHPPRDWAAAMHDAYRDGVARFDTAIGDLLAGLRARGLAGHVTIVMVSDHGEEFCEHGGYYHGTTLYEEQLHVPLVIEGPDLAAAERLDLARQIDIAPTVLGRLGISAPDSFEGRDLLAASPAPVQTLAEEDHEGNVLRSLRTATAGESLKLIVANPSNPRGLKQTELYDLAADSKEQTALLQDATALSKRLDAALTQARRGGGTSQTRDLDNDARAQLRALGYVE